MFGGFSARNGSIGGFTPPQPGLLDKIGLAGDILTGRNVTGARLDQDAAFAQQQYQSQHPAPMNVGGNLVDPSTGKVLFAPPPALDAFGQQLKAAGIDPTSTQGQGFYRQKVQNDVDPIHAYPTTDAAGNQGLIFKRPSEMGAAGTPAVQIKGADDYAALAPGTPFIDPFGQHRVKGGSQTTGGAAPATGPGGFPLYPAGHRRNPAR
jgi:hypothetical protein